MGNPNFLEDFGQFAGHQEFRMSHSTESVLFPHVACDVSAAVSVAGVRNVIQLFAVALGAASLAACAQSSVVSQRSELPAANRQASVEHNRKTSFVTNRRLAVRKKHTPFASDKNAAKTQVASHGVASFYTEGTQTANGEKFEKYG